MVTIAMYVSFKLWTKSTDSLNPVEILRSMRKIIQIRERNAGRTSTKERKWNSRFFFLCLFILCKVVHSTKIELLRSSLLLINDTRVMRTSLDGPTHTDTPGSSIFYNAFLLPFVSFFFVRWEMILVCDMIDARDNDDLHIHWNPHYINEVNVSSFCAGDTERRQWNYEINGLFDLSVWIMFGFSFVEITAHALRPDFD